MAETVSEEIIQDANTPEKMQAAIELMKRNAQMLIPKKDENYWGFDANDPCDIIANISLDIAERAPVGLTGHTGTGKTSKILQIAARMPNGGVPVVRVNFHGQTSASQLLGFHMAKNNETPFIYGLLPLAMKMGWWFIGDEIDFGDPEMLAPLNPVLEEDDPKLILQEVGSLDGMPEIIRPHKRFRFFCAGNTMGCMQEFRHLYQGTNIMNEAWLDRLRLYHVGYLQEEQEAKVLFNKFPSMKAQGEAGMQGAREFVQVANEIRLAFEAGNVDCTFSTRRLIEWVKMIVRTKDPMKAAELAIYPKVNRSDAEQIRLTIQATVDKYTN